MFNDVIEESSSKEIQSFSFSFDKDIQYINFEDHNNEYFHDQEFYKIINSITTTKHINKDFKD